MKSLIAFISFSLSLATFGHNAIAPKNSLKVPVGAKDANSITKEQFNQVLDRIEKIYAPIVQAHGAVLEIDRKWDDATVNSFASRKDGHWFIHMLGGIARYQYNSVDGFALVACHELGHHLGGAPKLGGDSSKTWITNEGQADYFGTTKCFRRYAQDDDNTALVQTMKIPAVVVKRCQKTFNLQEDVAICERGAIAGYHLARVLADIDWPKRKVSFDTPDRHRVWWTKDSHPKAQCRLDTYFHGSLCDKSYTLDFDDDNPVVAACTRKEGYNLGPRPRCWYKP